MTGEDCSQPPDGVADTMLPAWSMMSKCTVSPRTAPARSSFVPSTTTMLGSSSSSWVHTRPTVGSPAPAAAVRGPASTRTSSRLPKPLIVPARQIVRGEHAAVARAAGVHHLLRAAETVDRLGDKTVRPALARALDLALAVAAGAFRLAQNAHIGRRHGFVGEQRAGRRHLAA